MKPLLIAAPLVGFALPAAVLLTVMVLDYRTANRTAGHHTARIVEQHPATPPEAPRYIPLPPTQPPGQLHLWRPQPRSRRPRWIQVVTITGAHSERLTDLTIAATRAALVAGRDGAAWLVADDRTYAHITTSPTGPSIAPATGWPVLAARIITRHPQETTP